MHLHSFITPRTSSPRYIIPPVHHPHDTSPHHTSSPRYITPPYIIPTIHRPRHISSPPYIAPFIHHSHHTSPLHTLSLPNITPTMHHLHHTSSPPYITTTIHHPLHTSSPPYNSDYLHCVAVANVSIYMAIHLSRTRTRITKRGIHIHIKIGYFIMWYYHWKTYFRLPSGQFSICCVKRLPRRTCITWTITATNSAITDPNFIIQ